ncbi:MAG: hypothetical protein LKG53_01570 [Lachnospiraceae bacterium]|nr:hypothetical protein [Lachnospiraceae bacterium]
MMRKMFAMARQARNLPSDNEKKFAMARPAENLPSNNEKEVCDGTRDGKFTI